MGRQHLGNETYICIYIAPVQSSKYLWPVQLKQSKAIKRGSVVLGIFWEGNICIFSHMIVFCATRPHEEMVEHLFLHCSFARDCWNLVASFLALQLCQRLLESGRYSSAYCSSTFGNPWEFQNTAWCIFLHMEIIVLMCWSVWTVRNNLIFRNEAVSLDRCKLCFLSVFGLGLV